jgi:transcriptional regulator with XRE-family HTH domain
MPSQTITPSQCKNARRVLSLSQRRLSEESEKSLSYIKQFETGRFNPGEEFQQALRKYFESRNIDVDDLDDDEPLAATEALKPGQPRKPPIRRPCFYVAPELTATNVDSMLGMIETSIDRLGKLLSNKVSRNFFGEVASASEEMTRRAFSELALVGLLYAALTGRFTIEPQLITDPRTQQEVIADFLARARGDNGPEEDDEDDEATA